VVSTDVPAAYNAVMATVEMPAPTVPKPSQPLLVPTPEGRMRFSRDTYHRLVEVGVLQEDSRVELIDGEIYMMSPIGPFHGALVRRLMKFFVKQLPDTLECSIQLPIVAGNHSEPEPDVAIVRSRDDNYQREHPSPTDTVLLIEVSQSSLPLDLGLKLQLYASSGIAEYWVINIERKTILVHRTPSGNEYRDVTIVQAGDTIAPLAAPECRLDVAWLFH